MKTGSNTLDRREDEGIDTCTTCPKLCRWACPVSEAEARETSSPWNLVTMSGLVKRGAAAPASMGSLAYHCTHCGACTEACLHRNDVPLWLSIARSRALAAHQAPESVGEVRGHFAVAGNPYGAPLERSLEQVVEASESRVPRSNEAKETVYFPGCATLHERPDAAVSFLRALALRGIGGVHVANVSAACCGLPLLWAGDLEGFRAHAQRLAPAFKDVETLVVHDAACADAMTRRFAEASAPIAPKVVQASHFLADRLGLPPLDLAAEQEVAPGISTEKRELAYMDTCNLARNAGAIATPRRVIAKVCGQTPAELPGLRGIRADCCGAGGLLPITAPSTATAMAEARIDAFRSTGASRLIVATPRCAAHLNRVDPTIDVADVSTLLARLS